MDFSNRAGDKFKREAGLDSLLNWTRFEQFVAADMSLQAEENEIRVEYFRLRALDYPMR